MRIARARARARRDSPRLDANRTGAAAAPRLKKIDPNASVAGRRPRAPRSMDPRIPRADARSDPRHGRKSRNTRSLMDCDSHPAKFPREIMRKFSASAEAPLLPSRVFFFREIFSDRKSLGSLHSIRRVLVALYPPTFIGGRECFALPRGILIVRAALRLPKATTFSPFFAFFRLCDRKRRDLWIKRG